MQKRVLSFSLFMISLLSSQRTYAYDFELNGFYYNLNSYDLTVAVTYGEKLYEGDIVIPESISYKGKTMEVVSIGNSAFKNCISLSSIKFGGSIKYIEEHAFEGCSNLSKLSIPSNITHLGNSSFYNCSNLKELTIEDSESPLRFGTNGEYSPSCAFNCKLNYLYYGRILGKPEWSRVYDLDNSELTTILIGNKVTSIVGLGGSKITQITIPASVKSIGEGTFKGCINLKRFYRI